jgi:hypothetical protein
VNHWIRQLHRWVSVVFTLAVLANFAAIAAVGQDPAYAWVAFLPLLPLFVLLFTGLWLFVLPYATRWRRQPSAG